MSLAIVVKFIPCSLTKPARYKAVSQAGEFTCNADSNSVSDAAAALARLHNWAGTWLRADLPDGHAVFVKVAGASFKIDPTTLPTVGPAPYQPKTGQACDCKPGVARDNCPKCEGTGQRIDFKAIRDRRPT